jgi:hypothetical protein
VIHRSHPAECKSYLSFWRTKWCKSCSFFYLEKSHTFACRQYYHWPHKRNLYKIGSGGGSIMGIGNLNLRTSEVTKRVSQMKHQLDATLCRFYFCRVTLDASGASAHHQEYLKLVRRPLVHVLSLQVSHHISKWNTNLMQHCASFIFAESLYMFRAQAPIIRSI